MSPALVGAKKIGEFFLFMHHFDSVCVRERERDRRNKERDSRNKERDRRKIVMGERGRERIGMCD